MNDTLQASINQSYNEANSYDAQLGHGIDETESALWKAELLSSIHISNHDSILDVGAGTGVFSRLWLEWGGLVTCLEPAEKMLEKARVKLASFSDVGKVNFVLGDTHNSNLFDKNAFDFVVSRQAACYFQDPFLVFQNWKKWLKPNGQVVIVDGLWFREDWNNHDLVDQLPLSCLQTRATIRYLLEKSGFQIIENKWLEQVNEYLARLKQNQSPRYVIVARKNEI